MRSWRKNLRRGDSDGVGDGEEDGGGDGAAKDEGTKEDGAIASTVFAVPIGRNDDKDEDEDDDDDEVGGGRLDTCKDEAEDEAEGECGKEYQLLVFSKRDHAFAFLSRTVGSVSLLSHTKVGAGGGKQLVGFSGVLEKHVERWSLVNRPKPLY